MRGVGSHGDTELHPPPGCGVGVLFLQAPRLLSPRSDAGLWSVAVPWHSEVTVADGYMPLTTTGATGGTGFSWRGYMCHWCCWGQDGTHPAQGLACCTSPWFVPSVPVLQWPVRGVGPPLICLSGS